MHAVLHGPSAIRGCTIPVAPVASFLLPLLQESFLANQRAGCLSLSLPVGSGAGLYGRGPLAAQAFLRLFIGPDGLEHPVDGAGPAE